MGDVVSLVEQVQESIDQDEAQRLAERMFKRSFNLDDMLAQFEQVRKMGPMKDLMKKLPTQLTQALPDEELDEGELARQCAIIQSMTPWERFNPDEIHNQRRARVARGAGATIRDVNQLLKSFKEMRKMMRGMKDSFMGRAGLKQMERRKAKMPKQMKRGGGPGLPGLSS
jgi:signal recognition particle subunit SRP54